MVDIRVLERLTASDLFLLLWEDCGWSTDIGGLAILDGSSLPDRRVGAFLKLHHVLADGPAAMAAFGALLDHSPEAPDGDAPPWTPAPFPSGGELLRDNLRRRRQEVGRGWSGLVHPRRTLLLAGRVLPAWREVLTDRPAPRTSLNH